MAVFLNVLENIISMYTTIHFAQVMAKPTADDFVIICTCKPFLLIYCNDFRNIAVEKKLSNNLVNKMVCLTSSQHVVNMHRRYLIYLINVYYRSFKIQGKWSIFKAFSRQIEIQGLFEAPLQIQGLFKPVRTLIPSKDGPK